MACGAGGCAGVACGVAVRGWGVRTGGGGVCGERAVCGVEFRGAGAVGWGEFRGGGLEASVSLFFAGVGLGFSWGSVR